MIHKDGIYIVMLAGALALWLAMAFSVPGEGASSGKDRPPARKKMTEAMPLGNINPTLAFFLMVLCAAGFGMGLVTDIVLYLQRKVRQEREPAGVPAAGGLVPSVPWVLSDIFRFVVIFVFLFTSVNGAVYVCLAHKWIGRSAAETAALVAGTLGVYVVMLLLIDRILIRGYAADIARLGISFRQFFRNAWRGAVGYVAFIPAYFLLLLASLLVCQMLGIKPVAHELVEIFSSEKSPYMIAYLVVLAVGLAPVYEEIVFRGFIYGVLRKYAGVPGAMALSALFFAAIHFNAAQFIPVCGLGMMLAYLYEKTGTLVAPVAFHAINNGISVCITLLWLKTM
jgi:membrane protease YdiL (CAAX protease family)